MTQEQRRNVYQLPNVSNSFEESCLDTENMSSLTIKPGNNDEKDKVNLPLANPLVQREQQK